MVVLKGILRNKQPVIVAPMVEWAVFWWCDVTCVTPLKLLYYAAASKQLNPLLSCDYFVQSKLIGFVADFGFKPLNFTLP